MSEANDAVMTPEEALTFVREVLSMSSPELKLQDDRKLFLDELIALLVHHLPYSTLRAVSRPPGDRCLPSFLDIKQDMSSKIGGLCYELGVFCWMLISALGFRAFLVPCGFLHLEHVHVATIVYGLTADGSMHLIDISTLYPGYRLIPLDFDHVSPEYRDSFLRYRFVREGDIIIRQHSTDTDPAAANPENFKGHRSEGWISFFYIHIGKHVDPAFFHTTTMTSCYTEVGFEKLFFLNSIRCAAWPNGRLVYIKDITLLVEDEEGVVQKSYLKSREEILEAFAHYFPQISRDLLTAALENENITLDYTKKMDNFELL